MEGNTEGTPQMSCGGDKVALEEVLLDNFNEELLVDVS
jgi:hypothetical protein